MARGGEDFRLVAEALLAVDDPVHVAEARRPVVLQHLQGVLEERIRVVPQVGGADTDAGPAGRGRRTAARACNTRRRDDKAARQFFLRMPRTSQSDGVSLPEPTGVHTQPGGGIRAALTELEECKSQIARRESFQLASNTLRRCL